MKLQVQIVLVLLAATWEIVTSVCCEEYCYSADRDKTQVTKYSTKTPYQVAKGSQTNNDYNVPNCTPQKIWLVSRHGTRLPSTKEIPNMRNLQNLRDEIIDNYEQRRSFPDIGALCDTDLAGFKNWRWNESINENVAYDLSAQGYEDLRFIGRRFQRIYPNLIDVSYDEKKFLFRHTNTKRCENSFHAFVEGIFGIDAWKSIVLPSPPENDTLLKPYDLCPAWVQQSDKKKDAGSEYKKFQQSKLFQGLVSDVSQRLGFKFNLPEKQIDTIWDTCRYELAWYLEKYSPWCAAFTKKHVEILEYLEDIKYYYKQGPGSEINSKIMCSLVQDLLNKMGNDDDPRVTVYFAHSLTVQLLETALQIATDDRDSLRADNFEQMKYRSWRTSKIGPFAANIAAVKYNCPREQEQSKIMFFLNEKPIQFEWCKVGLCNYATVAERFKQFKNGNCDDIFCPGSSASNSKIPIVLIGALTLFKIINSFAKNILN